MSSSSSSIIVDDALLGATQLAPYYRRAIAALQPVARPGLGTVAVDRHWRLYWDPAWLASLPAAQRASVIALHEVAHLLRDHAGRGVSNRGGDLEINSAHVLPLLPPGGLSAAELGLPPDLLAEEYDRMCEDHHDHDHGCCGGGSGAGRPIEGEIPADDAESPGLPAVAAEILRDQVAEDVRAAARAQPGSVPGAAVMWAEDRARAIAIPWQRLLGVAMRRAMAAAAGRDTRSWARPSPRAWARGVCAPGPQGVRLAVGLLVDTSASMGAAGATVLGIVRSLAGAGTDLREVCCDTVARRRGRKGSYTGGGGTDLRAGIALACRRAAVIVIVSDCECGWPAEAPRAPAIVIRVGAGQPPAWARAVVDAPPASELIP